MKKICSIIAVLILCMAFAGCSQESGQSTAGMAGEETPSGYTSMPSGDKEEISQSRNDNEVNMR